MIQNNNDDEMVLVNNTTVEESQLISSQHMDYILATSLDVYGRRMATCSGDRMVRVWELKDGGNEWNIVTYFQAHRGAVTAIAWAHAEFGNLLATAGADHDVKIWEESNSKRWTVKAALTEARKSINSIEFAPRHWGLKLATGSADGCIRLYEAVDIMNLTQWPLAATLPAFTNNDNNNTNNQGCTSVSWCTGRFDPPTVAAGGGSHVIIYRYSETTRAWQSILSLPTEKTQHILDVAWAPNVGRRYHSIAVASDDNTLRIYRLGRNNNNNNNTTTTENKSKDTGKNNKSTATATGGLELESLQEIRANVWRCSWNVTGTVLATAGDGGVVQLWKTTVGNNYECVSKLQGDLNQVAMAAAAADNNNMMATS